MLKLINMSKVSACRVSDCAYNATELCHAIAITVGDGDRPMCDTFFAAASHSAARGAAGVGACKVSACRHNRELECTASGIEVGNVEGSVRCLTFAAP